MINVGCFGQTVNVSKIDTNDTEKKLPFVKSTLPTGVFESKVLSASNLSAVGTGDSLYHYGLNYYRMNLSKYYKKKLKNQKYGLIVNMMKVLINEFFKKGSN